MFGPGVRVARVNLKPLVDPRIFDRLSPEYALRKLQKMITKGIKLRIQQSKGLSPAAQARLAKAFRVVLGDSSVTIVALDPIFRPLVQGRQRKQMSWLTKATRPIPIELPTGEIIFRNATPRSMADGSWYHPARESLGIIEGAKKDARDQLKKTMKAQLLKQFREAMRR